MTILSSIVQNSDLPESEALIASFYNEIHSRLPKFYKDIRLCRGCFGDYYLKIVIAASNYEINRVKGQFVQDVSLNYELKTGTLTTQVFGGNGGGSIYVKPQKNLYLYMESVKIPFRKVTGKESAIKALGRFCDNYLKALKDNRDILMYQDLVNYDELLN